MDAFVSPAERRLSDLYREEFEGQRRAPVPFRREAQLTVSVATLSTDSQSTWKSFVRIFDSFDALWITPDTLVTMRNTRLPNEIFEAKIHIETGVSSDETGTLFAIHSRTLEQTAPTLEALLSLLSQSDDVFENVRLDCYDRALPISASALQRFMKEVPSRRIAFAYLTFSEDQCHTFTTIAPKDLNLKLVNCVLSDGGVALIDSLRRNRGPSGLTLCGRRTWSQNAHLNDFSSLSDAIHQNTNLKTLRFEFADIGDNSFRAILEGLKWNQGLLELSFHFVALNDENWSSLMAALQHHPALSVLRLTRTVFGTLSEEQKIARTQQMKEMLEWNTVLSNVNDGDFSDEEYDMTIVENEIKSLLEINRHRPMMRAVKEERDADLRARLLGRSLSLVQDKQRTLTYMLLIDNADLVAEHGSEENRLLKRIRDLDDEANRLAQQRESAVRKLNELRKHSS